MFLTKMLTKKMFSSWHRKRHIFSNAITWAQQTFVPRKFSGTLALGLLVALAPVAVASAVCNPEAQTCSNNYQVTESYFGAGGQYSCSAGGAYCANQSAGEQTVGKACDPGDQKCIQAGFNTNREPFLEFIVNTSSVDVGVLDESETHVGQATFSVKTYLADGYQVTTESLPPKTAGHTFAAGSLSSPSPGTEFFGMNLVANSCPGSAPGVGLGSCSGSLGADPVCDPVDFCNLPDGDVTIDSNYSTANSYYYPSSGSDTLISSTSSTGSTDFTLSYIFDISNVTPAGTYRMQHNLVATSTF